MKYFVVETLHYILFFVYIFFILCRHWVFLSAQRYIDNFRGVRRFCLVSEINKNRAMQKPRKKMKRQIQLRTQQNKHFGLTRRWGAVKKRKKNSEEHKDNILCWLQVSCFKKPRLWGTFLLVQLSTFAVLKRWERNIVAQPPGVALKTVLPRGQRGSCLSATAKGVHKYL